MANAVLILAQLETDLIVAITKNLATGAIGSAAWRLKKLGQLGRVSSIMAEQVAAGTAESIAAASAEMDRAARGAITQIDENIPKTWATALQPNADDSMKAIFTVWDEIAASQLNQTGANLLASANRAYIDIIEKTTAETLAGIKTGRQAIADASRAWADSGLPALIDAGGRRWSTEAYAQTVVRSNVRNVSTQTQLGRMDQWGVDLVEVDSHAGAREGCEPYQGRIYSRSGDSRKYPPLSSTSMGEPAGLFGINCGHSMYPFFDGSKKTYSPQGKKANDATYQNSQRQRDIERAIRRSKREEQVALAAGDQQGASRAAEKVSNQQEAMRAFINDTGRTRRRQREQI